MIGNILITAQYLENYSETNEAYWKPKGHHQFIIKDVDVSDVRDDAMLNTICQMLCRRWSNDSYKYIFKESCIKFFEPVEMDRLSFNEILKEVCH